MEDGRGFEEGGDGLWRRHKVVEHCFNMEGEGLGCLSQSGMEGEKGFERGRSAPL